MFLQAALFSERLFYCRLFLEAAAAVMLYKCATQRMKIKEQLLVTKMLFCHNNKRGIIFSTVKWIL
jgi:hypothetical protein